MSTVYMALQEKLNRIVAIKILDPALLKNKTIEIRFLQEAETAANLYHTNIISIYDIDRVGEHTYIVMEYLQETLKQYMLSSPHSFLQPLEAIDILKPIVVALDYAHSRGIIHRDIKSENIMFREDDTPVLTDFGIARALDSDKDMTRTGMSLGTPYYMSPEQCRAEDLDGRSDIYSLGVVFFEIITGRKPYEAESPMAVALKHIQEPLPQLPESLQTFQPLIEKMMAKRKEERVTGGLELLKLMDALQQRIKLDPKPQISDRTIELRVRAHGKEQSITVNNADKTIIKEPPPPIDFIVTTPTSIPATKKFPVPKILNNLLKMKQPLERILTKKILGIGLLIAILFAIFIIAFNLGSGAKVPDQFESADLNPIERSGMTAKINREKMITESPSYSHEFLEQDDQFKSKFKQALLLIKNKDFEGAMKLTQGLKDQAEVPEILELEKKINSALEEKAELEFNTYFSNAKNYFKKGNFKKARENIRRAKAVKGTTEVLDLEKRIHNAYLNSQKKLKQNSLQEKEWLQKEARAFQMASKKNSIEAYRKYLEDFPSGQHEEEAIARINQLEEMDRQINESRKKIAIQKINLRGTYETLNYSKVESMVKRYDFFDNTFNQKGSFKNKYKLQPIGDAGSERVVRDLAADLLWYYTLPAKEMTFSKAEKWIKNLNSKRLGGYNDWRFPTIEEAASLLRKKKNINGLYIDPIFLGNIKHIWTGDKLRLQTYWVIIFLKGIVYADSKRTNQQVFAVRSLK